MNPILSYTLHVSVAFALFYLVYKLFLSTDTFFVRNRFYHLGSMLVSLISPLLKFKIKVLVPAPDFSYAPSYAYSPTQSIPVPEVNYWHTAAQVALYIYAMGVTFYLIRIVWAYHKVIRLILKSERKKLQDLILVITRLSVSPFSLLKWLVIPSHHLDHPYFENIVQHESIHSRQYHSVDLFLAELLVAIQWFNPFAWWLKKSMVENHEFIVDQVILRNGMNPQQYQYSLLNFTTGSSQLAVVNYFNANLLKKRIRMMNKNKSPKWHGIKNLSILIIAVAVIGLTASFEKVAVAQNVKSSESKSQPFLNENGPMVNQTFITSDSSKAQSDPNEKNLQPQTQISSIDELKMYLTGNLRYPQEAAVNGWMGIFMVNFSIDQSGRFNHVSTNEPLGNSTPLDEINVVGYNSAVENAESVKNTDPHKLNGGFLVFSAKKEEYVKNIDFQLFLNEMERCLKNLPSFSPELSGKTYSLPVKFYLQNKPSASEPKDTSRSLQFRNTNTNTVVLVDKEENKANKPIYFLNGKRISETGITSIPPSDILSISVLKDKSATLLYGDEGKNGVVQISTKNTVNNPLQPNKEQTFIVVEQNARFQDGDHLKFQNTIESLLNSNLSNTSKDEKIKVIVQFTVDKTGTVGDVNILKSPNSDINTPIIQAIMSSPKWKPALQDGKPVKQQFVMPLKVSSEIGYVTHVMPKSLVLTPNPASDNVEITIPEGDSRKKYEVYVLDSNGKEVLLDKKYGPVFTISVLNLKTGIYHIIVNENGNQYQGSLSVNH